MNYIFPVKNFSNPFSRRALYKKAHSDPELANWIKENDPLYGQRSKLTTFENAVNDIIVTVCLPLGSSMEFIIGNMLNVYEGQSPMKRSKIGQLYDDIVYFFFDPFHRKRLLYDLTTVSDRHKAPSPLQ